MQTITIAHVGKASSHWYTVAEDYKERMKRTWAISTVSIKDAPSSYTIDERKNIETQKMLSSLSKDAIVVELHPDGVQYSSEEFAKKLHTWLENRTKIPTFIIAGTFGFTREVLPKNRNILSLSSMTFTHEITYSLLLEQIYRAYTIIHGIQYHH